MKKETPKECDCMKKVAVEIEKQTLANKKDKVSGFKIVSGKWETHSWYPKVRLYSNYVIESVYERKGGGLSKPRKDKVAIFYSYCPFCGKTLI